MAIVNDKINPPAQPITDPKTGKVTAAAAATPPKSSLDDMNAPNSGFFGSFFANNKKKKGAAIMEAPPPVLKASGTLSEREHMETEVISEYALCVKSSC